MCRACKTPSATLLCCFILGRAFESPWGASARKAQEAGLPQYVTFEPDHGGFNNIRRGLSFSVSVTGGGEGTGVGDGVGWGAVSSAAPSPFGLSLYVESTRTGPGEVVVHV